MRAFLVIARLMLVVLGVYSTGCSFIYTKGPQPGVQPPPPCTTDNGAPIADTVIASLSVAAVIAGAVLYAEAESMHCGFFDAKCDSLTPGLTGLGAMIIGVPLAAVFIPSAVVGFDRTAACRAWLEPKPQQPATTPAPQSSFLLMPQRECPAVGDAPHICSAVVLHDVAH